MATAGPDSSLFGLEKYRTKFTDKSIIAASGIGLDSPVKRRGKRSGVGEFPRPKKHKAEETEMTHLRSLTTLV